MPDNFTIILDPKFAPFMENIEDTPDIAKDVARVEMPRWATKVNDKKLYGRNNYAPRLAGSKYIRTGRLGADWGLQTIPDGVMFRNNTEYAGFVVGDGARNGQAGIHAGRWWLGRDRIEDEVPELIDTMGNEIVEALIP